MTVKQRYWRHAAAHFGAFIAAIIVYTLLAEAGHTTIALMVAWIGGGVSLWHHGHMKYLGELAYPPSPGRDGQ